MRHLRVPCLLPISLVVLSFAFEASARAQPPADGHQHEHHHQTDGQGEAVLCTICPASREADGTSWQPDDAAGHQHWYTAGGWQLAAHLEIDAIGTREGGPRGDDDFFSANYGMVKGRRQAGAGVFGFSTMWSLEPAMGAEGYPLLLQTGETADGVNSLTDRQHPHDLPMELAATYSRALPGERSLFIYAAPVGAPALGPPVFMHRPSASALPIAPITHHWFDSTHITYGVVTFGLVATPRFKIEGSAFRGREPDQHRWGFETPKLDSYSFRLSVNPNRSLAIQVSGGHLHSPEQLHPQSNATRLTASAMYSKASADKRIRVDAMAAWGRNQRHEVRIPVTGGFFFIPGNLIHAVLTEGTVRVASRHAFVARFEHANKDELFGVNDPRHFDIYPVSRLTAGYAFDVVQGMHATVTAGVAPSWSWVDSTLKAEYGGTPKSVLGYVRLALH